MDESPLNIFSRTLSRRLRSAFSGTGESEFDSHQSEHRKGLVITLCFLTSSALWFMFSMQETYTQFFDFPTVLQNVPPEQALTSLPPSNVRVQVEAQGVQLLRLYYQPPTIPLDATLSPIDLIASVAKVTGSVRMESVVPARIELVTEDRVARRIPVSARVTLATDPGYHAIGAPIITPDSVTVSGARSIIESLSSWPSAYRRVSGVRTPANLMVTLSDTLTGLVELDAAEIAYEVNIQPFTEATRQIEVRVENAPTGLQITFVPASTSVTFQVPLQQYDNAVSAPDFFATVAYEDIRTDTTGIVYPKIHTPEGLAVRESRIAPNAFGYYFNLPEQN